MAQESVVPADAKDVAHCPKCGRPIIAAPVLQCAHCGQLHPLRCFFYQGGPGVYVAECVDLDLISEGESPEQAIGRLQEAMSGYLSVVFDGGATAGLMLRPSPLPHRLRYYWHRLLERAAVLRHKHFIPAAAWPARGLNRCP